MVPVFGSWREQVSPDSRCETSKRALPVTTSVHLFVQSGWQLLDLYLSFSHSSWLFRFMTTFDRSTLLHLPVTIGTYHLNAVQTGTVSHASTRSFSVRFGIYKLLNLSNFWLIQNASKMDDYGCDFSLKFSFSSELFFQPFQEVWSLPGWKDLNESSLLA